MDTDPRFDLTDPMGNGLEEVLDLATMEAIALASIGSLADMLALGTWPRQDGEGHINKTYPTGVPVPWPYMLFSPLCPMLNVPSDSERWTGIVRLRPVQETNSDQR